MPPLLPLQFLKSGESADVAEVQGDATWVGRMAELGIRTGSRLRMLRSGNPCLFQLDAARLTVRADYGLQILVRPVAAVG
jgi:Fe2+ transport system protein FeoA